MSRDPQPRYTLEVSTAVAVEGYAEADGSYRGKPEVHAAARQLIRDPEGPDVLRIIDSTGVVIETFRRGVTTEIGGRVLDNPTAAKAADAYLAEKLKRKIG